MAEKQVGFPPEQSPNPKVLPFMLILSILCIVVVVVILNTDLEAPFIGPWG